MEQERTTTDVSIELALEDWGRVAIIAHTNDLTINEAVNYMLREFLKMMAEPELLEPEDSVDLCPVCVCPPSFECEHHDYEEVEQAADLRPRMARWVVDPRLMDELGRNPDSGC